MKKIFKIITLLIVFMSRDFVFAYDYNDFNAAKDPSNKLAYGIEDVEITDSEMIITGWAYASNEHTIGGQNIEIDLIAIQEEDLETYADDPSYISSAKKVVASVNGSNRYYGDNQIYSSTCYTSDEKCIEVYYGYYNNSYIYSGIRTGNGPKGVIGNGASFATCKSSSTTSSCIHYDPFFKRSFDLNDIKNISEGGTKNIILIIKMRYDHIDTIFLESEGKTSCSWSDTSGYINCSHSITDPTYDDLLYRVLSFSESVMSYDSGKEIDVDIKVDAGKKFVNTTKAARRLQLIGGVLNPLDWNYYEYRNIPINSSHPELGNINEFEILGRKKIVPAKKGVGVTISGVGATYYEVSFNNTVYSIPGEIGNYVKAGSGGKQYLTSFWGRVNGSVVIESYEQPKPPAESCSGGDVLWGCEESKYTNDNCLKIIEKEYKDDALYNLNGGRCNNTSITAAKPSLKILRFYKFSESVVLNMRIDPSDNTSDSIYKTDRAWPGLPLKSETKFKTNRTISWIPAADDLGLDSKKRVTYYYVKRYYDANPTGTIPDCKKDEGYVSLEYLNDKNISYVNNITSNSSTILDGLVYDKLKEIYENYKDLDADSGLYLNNDTLSISYPYSNNYNSGDKYNNNNVLNKIGLIEFGPIIKTLSGPTMSGSSLSRKFTTEKNFILKDAYVKKNGPPYVVYSDSLPSSEYEYIGPYYNIPYDIESGEKLVFGIAIRNPSVLELNEERIKSQCELEIEDGNRETMNYRVIDLNNPFPNYEPNLVTNKAVNWLTIWNVPTSDGFKSGGNISLLLQRVQKSNIEKYNIDLYSKNDYLDKVRLYTSLDNNYLNAYLKNDGTSKFIEDNYGANNIFFRSGNIYKSGIGEEAVSGQ